MAYAAAIFIFSVMAAARTSSAPRIVAAAGADDGRACGLGLVGEDLRRGVGHGQHNGIRVHGADHLLGQHTGCRHADEDVRALYRFCQGALYLALIGHSGDLCLAGV